MSLVTSSSTWSCGISISMKEIRVLIISFQSRKMVKRLEEPLKFEMILADICTYLCVLYGVLR